MTKLTVAILVGLLALGMTVGRPSGNSVRAASAGTITGTATAIRIHTTGTALVLRLNGNRLINLTLSAHASIKSADGRVMTMAGIQLGDHLAVSKGGAVQDISQRLVSIKGIVSVAPLEGGDPLVVQPASAPAVLIDLSARTRYHDASHETARLEQLEDADQVQIQGLFDSTRGEMTRADSVTRLGPFHKKHGKTA